MSLASGPSQGRPVFAALLAGGKGTRFWPASRAGSPKQFLKLLGDRSLLRTTFERFAKLLPEGRVLVVTSPAYAERTRAELAELTPENLILEPTGRDTAPAAALAVRVARGREEDPIVIIAPTDGFIRDETAFARSLRVGIEAAERGSLVTFGIAPDRPATVYGYIEVASKPEAGLAPLRVLRFREKPDAAEAASFLASGCFFWNAGIFVWRASVFDQTLASVNPPFASALGRLLDRVGAAPQASSPSVPGSAFAPGFEEAWEGLPSISIDYALMERAPNVCVVPLAAGWSDLGGWEAVRELLPADAEGNWAGEGVLYVGATGCSVHREGGSPRPRLYALVETEGLVVVETPDAVLICRAGAGEALREVVKRLKASGREDLV